MKKIIFILFLFSPVILQAQMTPSYKMTKRFSVRQLEQWLRKNVRPRFVTPETFTISAQITTSWKSIHNVRDRTSLVGASAGRPSNSYNADVNLDFNYSYGRTWISTRTIFRSNGGLFGGTANSFDLSRAYIGYHFTVAGPVIFDVNIGRRNLIKIYNSQMIYRARSDGATLLFSYYPGEIVNIRADSGVYIERAQPFWISRLGLYNIAKLGFYLDYSFSHWGDIRPNIPSSQTSNGIELSYNLSQFLVGWEYKPQILKKDVQVFAAMILNHSAKITEISHGAREKTAGYVGFQFGNLKKQNDFSFQAMLQFCRLQSIPPWTMGGIGVGRTGTSVFVATNSQTVNDNTNFKGWEATLKYAVTDQLTLSGKLQRSVPMNKAIGQTFNFTSFKLETQYTF